MSNIEAGTLIAGKYRLIKHLSRGGMGSVWLAHHGQLDAPVVLKFMHSSLLDVPEARARFEREAKAAAQIRSPHVVHVYDHGIDADVRTPFIVMEYLEGEDLAHRLKRTRRLALDEAVRICEQVCKGLYRAHKLGIVHRDLKPGNIFLSEPDEDMVKLLDYGIAKETGSRRVVKAETTTTGQVLGSPHYMSPEQARGQKLDGRSDLWSLAVIVFRAVTGKRPFDGDDVGDLIVRICTDPVPSAVTLNPQLKPVADRFFERAFDRDADGRFQTAKAFAAEFKAAMLGTPTTMDAEASQEIPVSPGSGTSEPRGGAWDSKSSGTFTSSDFGAAVEVDDEAPTRATPSLADQKPPTRTLTEVSHSLTPMGSRPRQKRKLLVALAAALAVGVAAVVMAVRAVGSDADRDAAADSEAATAVGASAAPAETPAEPTAEPSAPIEPHEAASPEGRTAPSASASASAPEQVASAPPQPTVKRRPPHRTLTPKPQPRKRSEPDLGY